MFEGNFYHIYNRGNNRENIFFEEKNYYYFLEKYDKYLSNHLETYAYCLLPNHFHLLVRVKEKTSKAFETFPEWVASPEVSHLSPLEKAFKDFFITYAKAINSAYDRTGSLFQYKFKRKIIDKQKYLTRLIVYIHLNPIRLGLCKHPSDWKFSSYNSILSTYSTKVKKEVVLDWFGRKGDFIELHKTYRDFQKIRDLLW